MDARVQNMTGAKDESVYFKILGQNMIYPLVHVGGEVFSGSVPMSVFTPENYALCILVAVNADGVAFYDELLVSLLSFSTSMIVMEPFSGSPTDWAGTANH